MFNLFVRAYLATFFYEGALKEEPKNTQVLNIYAKASAEWGDKAKAQEMLEQSRKVDDKHVPTLNIYANACAEWGEREKAIELFEKALSLEPDNVIVINSYSQACAGWGEAEKAALLQKRKESLEKPTKETMPSRIASPTPAYNVTTPAPVIMPVQPVQPVETVPPPSPALETPAAEPAPSPTPGTAKEEILFTLTPEEKTWLTATAAEPLNLPAESAQWAGFTMLYSLFYWEGELDSLKELGIVPTLQRDYQRLFNITNDLEELVVKASTPPAREIPFREEWFDREGAPLKLIAYYDHQVFLHPGNPVCMAFLSRVLENFSWKGTARILKKELLSLEPASARKEWQPFVEKTGIDILTAEGRQKFRSFIQEQNQALKAQTLEPGGFTYWEAFDFINRYSNFWRDLPQYFPWFQFKAPQVSQMLGKLLGLLRRLKVILAEIRDLKAEALGPLGEFLREISPLVRMMQRLSHTAYELNKPGPIPWYVNGEIKEISDTHLVVIVERYGREKQEWVIPRQDFPDENPQAGQMFYAKIKPEQPDKLVDIKPLHVKEESFEDILCDLFGKEAYEKLAALWEKEGS